MLERECAEGFDDFALDDDAFLASPHTLAKRALGRHAEAAAQLRFYLESVPGAPDAGQVRGVLDAIEHMERLLR